MSNPVEQKKEKGTLDVFLFTSTFAVIAGAALWGFVDNDSFMSVMKIARDYIVDKMAWFMVLNINLFFVVLLYLAFGRFGDKKLGKDDEKPELSTFSWIAMLFGAGIGAGFCFWPIAEPLWHYYQMPYLVPSETAAAKPIARAITLFHWGFHLWAIWAIAGLVIAYPAFRQDKPMTIAVGLHGLMGDKVYTSPFGRFAEFCGAFATITAVGTGLGVGLMLITAGLKSIFGLEIGMFGQFVVMAIIIATYTIAAYSGIHSGMKILGDLNAYVTFSWFAIILIAGPTALLLDGMVETWGSYISNFAFMATFTDTAKETDGWPGSWSIFYYVWNTAWAPFVGGFIARISRGRTIREFVLGVLIVPVIVTFIWHGVLGTAAQYVDSNNLINIMDQMKIDPALSVYALVDAIGGGMFVKCLVLLNVATFLITSADAASYFVAMQMNRGMLNPPRPQILLWGCLIAALAVVFIASKGLAGIQIAGVISGAPFIIILSLMAVALLRTLFKEYAEEQKRIKNPLG